MEVSAAIISNRGCILCFKKGTSKFSYIENHYEFPGGKLEAGESPVEALVRELKEEINYDVNYESLQHFCDIDYDYEDFSVKLHYFLIHDSNPIYVLNEHTDAIWKSIKELSDLNWIGADFIVVKQLEERGLD